MTTLTKTITYDDETKVFDVKITIPRRQRGPYTYGDGEWEQDAVAIHINDRAEEYALSQAAYLDYKDDLQCTQPIVFFDTKEEALYFAEKYGLTVEFARYNNP